MSQAIKIIECPRDAMQGIKDFIPTERKAQYINLLLKCGFDTIDFGSFVSPKAIPQMRDTAELISLLDLNTSTKLLSIIANERGASDACSFEEIDYFGFPFSVSEEFQKRNTNSSIEESLKRVEAIQNLTQKASKQLVVYLSMGFGNPYGEEWNPEIVYHWGERLHKELGINILALSDTIGCAKPQIVHDLFQNLIPALPNVEFGAHLHTLPQNASFLVESAYSAGCNRFDAAIYGFGGCPMAADTLTGNMPTERMIDWFKSQDIVLPINENALQEAMRVSSSIFKNQ